MLTKYEWSNLAIIYDRDIRNIELAEEFKRLHNPLTQNIKDEVVLDANDKTLSEGLSKRLSSTTKDSGARVILVFTNSILAS
jgi:hypothetical protein